MSEGICCPLTEYDEENEFERAVVIKAATKHRCVECGETISVGSLHEKFVCLHDGHWSRYRTCLLCKEIRDHFACGRGYCIGVLWEELEDNFLPNMKAGGPCLEGLSARAKECLFHAWRAWKGIDDEPEEQPEEQPDHG